MTQLRRLRSDDGLKEVIQGTNRIFDALLGNGGGRVHLIDDDGVLKNTQGGATLGTSEPSLKVRSAIGEHVLVQHSAGIITLLEVTDAGVTISDLILTGGLTVVNLHASGTLTVDGNSQLGNSNTDTVLMTGPVTLNESINVKGNTVLGDAEADSVTIVDWIVQVTSNDLLFKDDAGLEIVRFGDTSSTWHLKVTGPMWATGNIESGGNIAINSSGFLSIGTSPAGVGTIRTQNNTSWFAKTSGGTNVRMIQIDTGDTIYVGDGTNATETRVSGVFATLYAGGTEKLRVDATGVGFNGTAGVAKTTLGAAAGVVYTVAEQALINNLRTCLQGNGLAN